jgi:deoxyribodipyrimidine photo-lyase
VVLVWLRRDLRLADNAAIREAARAAGPEGRLLPIFVWEPARRRRWAPGAAARWWLARSLAALDADLQRRGRRLALYRGDPTAVVPAVAAAAGARLAVWACGLEPEEAEDDRGVARRLSDAGVEPLLVPSGNLLLDTAGPLTREGRPYTVFTPYWRACLGLLEAAGDRAPWTPEPLGPAGSSPPSPLAPPVHPATVDVGALLSETDHAWSVGLNGMWRPGEAGAHAALDAFLDGGLAAYATDRDLVAEPGTSRLSPHLHWGELTGRQVWDAVAGRLAEAGLPVGAAVAPAGRDEAHAPGLGRSAGAFLRQLGWREFGHHLLRHFPETPERPLRGQFELFPWREDQAALHAWRRGLTGYPLVDAGMRELWTTGWMHNRARLVTASFLVKHLLLPWRAGEEWFWDTLVDADLADNALGWQWVAGSGADAAPYFRVFNPVTQARRYDPAGVYARRWIPELAGLTPAEAHASRFSGPPAPAAAGADLGGRYPEPVVDHGEARARALAAYDVMRQASRRRDGR